MGPGARLADEPLTSIRWIAGRLNLVACWSLVRWLEGLRPGLPSLADPGGPGAAPDTAAVRLRPDPSQAFRLGDVAAIRPGPGRDGQPLEVLVNLPALVGRAGILEEDLQEWLIAESDLRVRAMIDGLHHRLFALAYRGWRERRPWFGAERWLAAQRPVHPRADPLDQPAPSFPAVLRDLVGEASDQARVGARDLIGFWPLWGRAPRSAANLESLLEDYFEVEVRVLGFQPRRVLVGAEESFIDRQTRFRLRLGPMTADQVPRYLPRVGGAGIEGDAVKPLAELTRRFVGVGLEFDWEVVRRPPVEPDCRLVRPAEPGGGARLGWTTWLRTPGRRAAVESAVISAPRCGGAQPLTAVLGRTSNRPGLS